MNATIKDFEYYTTLEPQLLEVADFAADLGLRQVDGINWIEWGQVKRRFSALVGWDRQRPPSLEPEAVSVPLSPDDALSVSTVEDALDLAARRRRNAISEVEDELRSSEAYERVYAHLFNIFEAAHFAVRNPIERSHDPDAW